MIGRSSHRCHAAVPTASMISEPATNPITVPPSARSPVDPVVSAVVRSTDIAPSTTQKPCDTR